MLKKFLASLVLASYLFSLVIALPLAQAKAQWYNQDFQEWYAHVMDQDNPEEIFGERYTYAQVQWIIYSLFAFVISNMAGSDTAQCIFTNNLSDCKGVIEGTFDIIAVTPPEQTGVAHVFKTILADRPLSGITYVKEIGRKFHLIPEAQAQNAGFGFGALEPVRGIWQATRNVTYAIFVFITIVMAFMIMFRVKLSPQTVITIQSAIPKLVIGIILVTFSYAIAGFLIDLMYVFIGLVSIVFANIPDFPFGGAGALFDFLTYGPTIKGAGFGSGVLGFMVIYLLWFALTLLIVFFLGGGIGGLIGVVAGGAVIALSPIGGILGIIGVIAAVVIVIVLVWALLRTVWLLIRTFASVLLLTIFAPFQIAIGTIVPGVGFSTWLRNYLANLAVFPVVGLMFLLSYMFLALAMVHTWNTLTDFNVMRGLENLFGSIPLLGLTIVTRQWPPLLGGADQMVGFLFLTTSLIIVLMIPKAGNIIKSLIQGQPFAMGTAIGEALLPGAAYGGYALNQIGQGFKPQPFVTGPLAKRFPTPTARTQGLAGQIYEFGAAKRWWGKS